MMKLRLMTAAVVIAGIAGAATGDAAVAAEARQEERRAAKHVYPQAIRLKSIFGINDAVLSNTNRFPTGFRCAGRGMAIKFDKSFGGFNGAIVGLDERSIGGDSCHAADKPHKLGYIKLERVLARLRRELDKAISDKDLINEWQSTCDFVADILGVEPPKVKLVDLKRPRLWVLPFHAYSRVRFDLFGKQHIDVSLTEPSYVFRDGKLLVVEPGCVKVELLYNRDLVDDRKIQGDDVELESELDFGPDYCEKLSEVLRREEARLSSAQD